MGKRGDGFKCRICGHTEYTEVRQGNGIMGSGAHSHKLYCYCEGCTVMFVDPKKFSVAETKGGHSESGAEK